MVLAARKNQVTNRSSTMVMRLRLWLWPAHISKSAIERVETAGEGEERGERDYENLLGWKTLWQTSKVLRCLLLLVFTFKPT